jgi:ABC-2 type transport system ATP-binding protein
MSTVVSTHDLTKYYGRTPGIIDISLSIREGEMFGLIGPQGAGKTTLIRSLLGLLKCGTGEISIFGLDLMMDRKEILTDIGYVPMSPSFYPWMTVDEVLTYTSSFFKKETREKELLALFNLKSDKKIETLSSGELKALSLVQSLMHEPKLLLLDEPTKGLDPMMKERAYELLRKSNAYGTTILLSSESIPEVQRLCRRVGIMKQGRMLNTEDMETFKEKRLKKIIIYFSQKPGVTKFKKKKIGNLVVKNNMLKFLYTGEINDILAQLSQENIIDITIEQPDINEMFLHYFRD